MVDRYAHIRLEAKRSALEALSGKGNGTSNDTKGGPDGPPSLQPTDSMVGAWGFEPQTPTVSRRRLATPSPNYNGLFIIFIALPDQLPDQFHFLLCYIRFSSPPLIRVEAQPQLHSTPAKDLR
jgi:hypothetical protein